MSETDGPVEAAAVVDAEPMTRRSEKSTTGRDRMLSALIGRPFVLLAVESDDDVTVLAGNGIDGWDAVRALVGFALEAIPAPDGEAFEAAVDGPRLPE